MDVRVSLDVGRERFVPQPGMSRVRIFPMELDP
jgi:hypothetical protein